MCTRGMLAVTCTFRRDISSPKPLHYPCHLLLPSKHPLTDSPSDISALARSKIPSRHCHSKKVHLLNTLKLNPPPLHHYHRTRLTLLCFIPGVAILLLTTITWLVHHRDAVALCIYSDPHRTESAGSSRLICGVHLTICRVQTCRDLQPATCDLQVATCDSGQSKEPNEPEELTNVSGFSS